MNDNLWLREITQQFRKLRTTCEQAEAQVDDGDFFAPLHPEGNSIASLMKHLGGNLHSRWRDFLTSDGEKSDRHRDREFVTDEDSRATIHGVWNQGWSTLLGSLEALTPADLAKAVTIRGQPHSVIEALQRSLGHTAYHAGQVVLLARYHAGPAWQTLSIPPGQSEQFNARMRQRFDGPGPEPQGEKG